MAIEGNLWNIKESLISPKEDRKGEKIVKRDGTKRKHSNMVDKLNTTGNYINSNILNTLKQQQKQQQPHRGQLVRLNKNVRPNENVRPNYRLFTRDTL